MRLMATEPENNQQEDNQKKEKKPLLPWRKNVLLLMCIAYLALILIFVAMLVAGAEPASAYDKIGTPFVALVGGTIAVTKDLL